MDLPVSPDGRRLGTSVVDGVLFANILGHLVRDAVYLFQGVWKIGFAARLLGKLTQHLTRVPRLAPADILTEQQAEAMTAS